MFTFDSVSELRTTHDTGRGGGTALLPPFLNEEHYKTLFAKWGLLQPNAWCLHTYRYVHQPAAKPCTVSENVSVAASTVPGDVGSLPRAIPAVSSGSVSAAALRFHHGMAEEFLRALFDSPAVGADLLHIRAGSEKDALCFRPLTCRWTTLAPLRESLVDAKVVRQSVVQAEDSEGVEGADSVGQQFRLVAVKRAEELLPHGEVISDELRALFLQARSSRTSATDFHPSFPYGRRDGEEKESDEEDGEVEDDADDWGMMAGEKLTRRQLRSVFDKSARTEFLYHLLWRLVAGGGPLNQFEDDAAVYLGVVRQLYRSLITSLRVREVTEEGDVTALDSSTDPTCASDAAAVRYEPVIDSFVYEVFSVPGKCLFPRDDGVSPSNLNYCYVVVNPQQQTATLWYHGCH